MQRYETRLRPEPDEGRHGDERLCTRAGGCHRRGISDPAVVREREERDPDAGSPEVRDRDIRIHGRASLPVSAREQDRGRRDERHQLPEDKEADDVASGEHTGERQQEHARQGADRRCVRAPGQVVAREQERRDRGEREQGQEEPAERVEAECQAYSAVKRGADRLAAREYRHPGNPEQRHRGRLDHQPGAKAVRRGEDGAARERRDTRERRPGEQGHL